MCPECIRREGVPKAMGVCNFDSASLAMMAKKRAQTRGSHPGAASRSFRSQGKKAGLITLQAADAHQLL